jgi:lysophospholipase L1-like esterase
VPDFIDSTAQPGRNECHRSQFAPPQSGAYSGYVNELLGGASYDFWACSGAEIENVLSTRQWRNEAPQVTTLAGINDKRPVEFVTISIGGNDAEFKEVLRACWASRNLCQDTPRKGTDLTWNEIVTANIAAMSAENGPLDDVYAAIAANVTRGARVLVLGYPRLFRKNVVPAPRTRECQLGFWEADVNWMNDMTKALNDAIQDRVAQAAKRFPDVKFEYVDQFDALAKHELCAGLRAQDEWLHGIVGTGSPFSFHPKARGQRALADRVWTAITAQ